MAASEGWACNGCSRFSRWARDSPFRQPGFPASSPPAPPPRSPKGPQGLQQQSRWPRATSAGSTRPRVPLPRAQGRRRGPRGRRGAAPPQQKARRGPRGTGKRSPRPQPQKAGAASSAAPGERVSGANGCRVTCFGRGHSPEEHTRAEVRALQRVGLHLLVHWQHLAGRGGRGPGSR